MLDTNTVSDLLRNPFGKAAACLRRVGDRNVAISIVTAAELRIGAAKKKSPALTARVEAVLAKLEVLPFDVPADEEYADIRCELQRIGKPIGPNDLLIAAHARSLGAVIVTANDAEFRRVPGLAVENWVS